MKKPRPALADQTGQVKSEKGRHEAQLRSAVILSLATVVSDFSGSKSPTTGKPVFVWAYPGRGELSAAAPISPMNSRRCMSAPTDHNAAL